MFNSNEYRKAWMKNKRSPKQEIKRKEKLTSQGKCVHCECLLIYHEHNCGYTQPDHAQKP